MYKAFFGLKSKPFRLNPHLRFLFNSEAIQRAVNTLKYGLYQREGLVLLTGAPGCGKSLLIQNITRRLPDAGIRVHTIATPRANGLSLLRQISSAFALPHHDSVDAAQLLQALQQYLLGEVEANRRILLVIDEAHNLDDDALEVVRLISDMQSHGNLLLQIFLVAQPILRARLATPSLEALRQRFLVTDHIEGLTAEEVPQYILKRMQQAGWTADDVPFDAEAITRIQQFSDGNPRKINILCERLLTQAYVEEQSRISVADVEATLNDMEEEWRSSDLPSGGSEAPASNRLRDIEQRISTLDASLNQISQVTNTILVRLDNLRQD
ncbi:MAG: AAA family ATPase [Lautropia sp.]|nr:AAA family ATPase [Lautropia sp.]